MLKEIFKKISKGSHYCRRGLLGCTKALGITSWIVALFVSSLPSSFSILISVAIYFVIFSSAFIGGLIELGLALHPQLDKKITPWWKGFIQFSETLLLKTFAYNYLLIGNRKGASSSLISLSNGWFISLLILGNPILVFLSSLSGYGEYNKHHYSRNIKNRSDIKYRNLPCCPPFNVRRIQDKILNISIMSIDSAATMLALIEFTGVVVVSHIINGMFLRNDDLSDNIERIVNISRVSLTPLAALFGVILGLYTQIAKNKYQRMSQKGFFILNEFVQSATFSLAACVAFHEVHASNLFENLPRADKYIFISGATLLTSISALSQTYEEYMNKYRDREYRIFEAYRDRTQRKMSVELSEESHFDDDPASNHEGVHSSSTGYVLDRVSNTPPSANHNPVLWDSNDADSEEEEIISETSETTPFISKNLVESNAAIMSNQKSPGSGMTLRFNI